jgi:hypothetical protein
VTSIRLAAQVVEETATSIVLSYDVENAGDERVLVCNRLYNGRTDDGAYIVDPDVAYVLFEPGPVANITKRILDRGDDVMVEQPIQPCATVLEPGARFSEQIALPLPLGPVDPYRPTPRRDPSDAEPSRGLAVTIGWVAAARLNELLMPTVATTAGPLPIVKASPRVQQLERVDLDVSIPVLPPGPSLVVRRQCTTCGAINVGEHATCLRCHVVLPPPTAPAGPAWQPTHRVPDGGLPGYPEPGATTSTPLDAGLPLQVVERTGDWARVVAWTGWSGWVDARRLVPLNPGG